MRERNEQELFWAGTFGDQYSKRNFESQEKISSYIARWAVILQHIYPLPTSALELGCNIGLKIKALKMLCPKIEIEGVEINKYAAEIAEKSGISVHRASILDFYPERTYEMCFTNGVLIHIDPENLPKAYDLLYKSSSKYILINEYYNPVPVGLEYRKFQGKLFKRDFAGELMNRYPNLTLRDYGFFYHRDTLCTADDVTWFMLEKQS